VYTQPETLSGIKMQNEVSHEMLLLRKMSIFVHEKHAFYRLNRRICIFGNSFNTVFMRCENNCIWCLSASSLLHIHAMARCYIFSLLCSYLFMQALTFETKAIKKKIVLFYLLVCTVVQYIYEIDISRYFVETANEIFVCV
jgi:hypothetical protein